MNSDIDRPEALKIFSIIYIFLYISGVACSNHMGSTRKLSESILLNQEINFKQNPIEKYFFIAEKNYFEKQISRKKLMFLREKNSKKNLIFSIEKSIFSSKILLENFFPENIRTFFFKIIFLHDEKIFFDGIFFNLISCSRRIVLKHFQHDSTTLDASIKNVVFFSHYLNITLGNQ